MTSICCRPEVLYLGSFSNSCAPPLFPCSWEGAILRRSMREYGWTGKLEISEASFTWQTRPFFQRTDQKQAFRAHKNSQVLSKLWQRSLHRHFARIRIECVWVLGSQTLLPTGLFQGGALTAPAGMVVVTLQPAPVIPRGAGDDGSIKKKM